MSVERIFVLEHHPLEHAGLFAQLLQESAVKLCRVRLYAAEKVPKLTPTDGLIIMGGPMSVHEGERYPWLYEEIALVREATNQNRPVLGVCLGSQIIATAAGSIVAVGKAPEIGWYEVAFSADARLDPVFGDAPSRAKVFQWHTEGFSLPSSAVLLAHSQNYKVQAFRVGTRTYGLLFHSEINQAMVAAWRGTFGPPKGALAEPQAVPDYQSANSLAALVIRRLFLHDR